MKQGFIKVHRAFLNWEWYDEINVSRLFIHCLFKANFKDTKYKGFEVKKGSFVTGLDKLSKETGLTVRQTRTALDKLKATNELTIKTSSKGSIIQVVNYCKYQDTTSEATNQRQTNDKQTTSELTNERQLKKKEKNIYNNNTIVPPEKTGGVDWENLIIAFNTLTGKKIKVVNTKTRKQILARLKEGYSKQDIIQAIKAVMLDEYHVKTNFKYVTLEFLSRPDKFERYTSIASTVKAGNIRDGINYDSPTLANPYKNLEK